MREHWVVYVFDVFPYQTTLADCVQTIAQNLLVLAAEMLSFLSRFVDLYLVSHVTVDSLDFRSRYFLLGVTWSEGGLGSIWTVFLIFNLSPFWSIWVDGIFFHSFLRDLKSPTSVVFIKISFPSILVNSFQTFSCFLTLGWQFFLVWGSYWVNFGVLGVFKG